MSAPDMSSAIAARFEQQETERAEKQSVFTPDPVLEQQAERLQRMREATPQEYAAANFGDLVQRVETYQRRKAAHERNN